MLRQRAVQHPDQLGILALLLVVERLEREGLGFGVESGQKTRGLVHVRGQLRFGGFLVNMPLHLLLPF